MSKWHINNKGIPSICKADKRACPLGQHYESESEALTAINKEHQNEFGLLANIEDEGLQRRKDMADLICRITGIKSNGFDYECFASVSLAGKMGLDKVAITDRNGIIVNLASGGNSKSVDAGTYVKRSTEGLKSYYEKMNIPISDESLLSRVIYYSDNPEKGILVQSGGPNVLDAAIIKADKVVDIVEIKKLEGGAQLPLTSLDIDENGFIKAQVVNNQNSYIANIIKDINIDDADGTNIKLNFGSEDENLRHSLNYFVEEYKKKGATAFIYTTNNGNTINTIDMTRKTSEVIDNLIDENIEASLQLRANLQKQNADEYDIQRFNNVLSKKYFKNSRSSQTESFTLKSIREDKVTSCGKYVRVGGYVLPIEYNNYKDKLNVRIKKSDLKAFKLSLTGNIRINY